MSVRVEIPVLDTTLYPINLLGTCIIGLSIHRSMVIVYHLELLIEQTKLSALHSLDDDGMASRCETHVNRTGRSC